MNPLWTVVIMAIFIAWLITESRTNYTERTLRNWRTSQPQEAVSNIRTLLKSWIR